MSPEKVYPNTVTISELSKLQDLELKGILTRTLTFQYITERDYAQVLHTFIFCAPTTPARNLEELNDFALNIPPTHLKGDTNIAELVHGDTKLPERFWFISEEDRGDNGPLQAVELKKQGMMLHSVTLTIFPTLELAQAISHDYYSVLSKRQDRGSLYDLHDFDTSRLEADISTVPKKEVRLLDTFIPFHLWDPNDN